MREWENKGSREGRKGGRRTEIGALVRALDGVLPRLLKVGGEDDVTICAEEEGRQSGKKEREERGRAKGDEPVLANGLQTGALADGGDFGGRDLLRSLNVYEGGGRREASVTITTFYTSRTPSTTQRET